MAEPRHSQQRKLRRHCHGCDRPAANCLCAYLEPVKSQTQLHILMHPSELKSAKGTARLTNQIVQNCGLWHGESESDFAPLRQELAQSSAPTFLLYPDDNAQFLEELTPAPNTRLLLLDGTWRKTHKMLALNPWLASLPKLSFRQPPKGNYQIRKAHRLDSLSTLEACAHALNVLDGTDVSPLLRAFEALKQTQLSRMPTAIRQRYRA